MEESSELVPARFTGSVSFKVSDAPNSADGQRYPGFLVTVADSSRASWTVRKRYCDFQVLNMNLQQQLPQLKLSLPPVRVSFNQNDRVIMEMQKQRVQLYLDRLAKQPECMESELVWEFFNPHSQRNLWASLSCSTPRAPKPINTRQPTKCESVPAGILETAAQSALETDLFSPTSTMSCLSTAPLITPDLVSPKGVLSPTSYPLKRTNSNETLSAFSVASMDTTNMTIPGSSNMSSMSICNDSQSVEEREPSTTSHRAPQKGLFWRLSSFGREILPDILSSAEVSHN